jgi:hypothetical protein
MRLQLNQSGVGPRRPWSSIARMLFHLSILDVAAAAAQATSGVDARTSLYNDNDATTISTSVVAARAALTDDVTVNAHYLIDAISSASIDVVSAATKRWTENRHEGEGGIGYADGTLSVDGGYVYSTENDWSSHTVSLGAQRDFMQHNLSLGLGASFVDNAVGRSGDRIFQERMYVGGVGLDAVWVASPNDLWSLTYSPSYTTGYQASPYRFPRFKDPIDPNRAFGAQGGELGESVPRTRVRHAVVLRYNRHLFEDSSLRSHMRVYGDDWGVVSLTGGTEYVVGFGAWELAAFVRGYAQRHAKFYRDGYAQEQRYMTADRELSTFYDLFGGGRVDYAFTHVGFIEELRLELKATAFGFTFPEFSRLPARTGFIGEFAVGAVF